MALQLPIVLTASPSESSIQDGSVPTRIIQQSISLSARPALQLDTNSERRIIEPGTSSRSARLTFIDGALPYERRLRHPLMILIEQDDEEVLVSEPEFQMHAGGTTEAAAVAAFRAIISGYLDVLASREQTLGDAARDHLAYLRSIISPT